MKKIIIAILIAISLPTNTMAITPGYGSEIKCHVWREGDGDPTNRKAGDPVYCKDYQDTPRRIYELEVIVQNLQNQIQNQAISSTQQSCDCDTKIAHIETRLGTLEKIVEFLQTNVITLLKTIISFLIK
jgi:hypothetical protein